MKVPSSIDPLHATDGSMLQTVIEKVTRQISHEVEDSLALEEPLEIQLTYGPYDARQTRSISVTMRTPGNDFDLAAGFLMTEGVIRDANDVEQIAYAGDTFNEGAQFPQAMDVPMTGTKQNTVRVDLAADVEVNVGSLQRNFYTTSSCGICGKIDAPLLCGLPARLRASQPLFDRTGGLHGAGLFDPAGNLLALREDVGRHNAVDKLIGSEFLADRTPLRDCLLLLSGRASFELLQKALMGGIPMVAAVGAPSSLAVHVAREFDITLIGFLREDHFNIYHGGERVTGYTSTSMGVDYETENQRKFLAG